MDCLESSQSALLTNKSVPITISQSSVSTNESHTVKLIVYNLGLLTSCIKSPAPTATFFWGSASGPDCPPPHLKCPRHMAHAPAFEMCASLVANYKKCLTSDFQQGFCHQVLSHVKGSCECFCCCSVTHCSNKPTIKMIDWSFFVSEQTYKISRGSNVFPHCSATIDTFLLWLIQGFLCVFFCFVNSFVLLLNCVNCACSH